MPQNICFFVLFLCFVHFFYYSKVFLNLLLVFEAMSLCFFLGAMGFGGVSLSGVTFYVALVTLVFGVCESVLGLAILVNCCRFHGVFMSKSFSFLGV